MPYTKTTWINGGSPGISAENLNNLETQYDEAVAETESDAGYVDIDLLNQGDSAIASFSFNKTYDNAPFVFLTTAYGTEPPGRVYVTVKAVSSTKSEIYAYAMNDVNSTIRVYWQAVKDPSGRTPIGAFG
jgi:hypothetical protein